MSSLPLSFSRSETNPCSMMFFLIFSSSSFVDDTAVIVAVTVAVTVVDATAFCLDSAPSSSTKKLLTFT